MNRAELAKELRDVADWLRTGIPKTSTEIVARQKGTLREALDTLDAAAALLEHDSLERDARRQRALKPWIRDNGPLVINIAGKVLATRQTGENWQELDAALDAWIEEHGE